MKSLRQKLRDWLCPELDQPVLDPGFIRRVEAYTFGGETTHRLITRAEQVMREDAEILSALGSK